ncbi:MAG: MFS transporter [Pelomonas sp.]|nr:MFS transporter [Roseateles sp.]
MRVAPFRTLLLGQGLSMAGDAVCLAALPIALLDAGLGAGVFGLVMAAVGLGTVVGAAAGGGLADRRSPRRLLAATDAWRGLLQLVATGLLVGAAPWCSLLPVYLLFGVAIGVARPCGQVLLASLLPKEALVAGNGALNFVDSLAALVLPATLGFVLVPWDAVWGVLFDGLSFGVAAVVTTRLPEAGARHERGRDSRPRREALVGLRAIASNAVLARGLAATLAVGVLGFPIFLVVAPYAVAARFDAALWGLCLAASGLGACLGSIGVVLLGAAQRRPIALAAGATLLLGAAMALLGFGASAPSVVLGAALVGGVEAAWLTAWATALQTLAPPRHLGKVVAGDALVTSGAQPLAYAGCGWLGGLIDPAEMLLLAAGACAVAGLALAMGARASR